MNNNIIQEFYYWCQKVLPTVYDESLSYYEFLCKLTKKLNEVIEFLNNTQLNNKKYVDEQIKILKDFVINEDLELKKYVNDEDVKVINYINQKVMELDEKIRTLQLNVNNQIIELEKTVDNKILVLEGKTIYEFNEIYKYIDDIIKDYNIECINPTNAKLEPLCKVINDVYNFLRYNALTCIEYDMLGITCIEFDNSITCKEFDINGSKLLGKNICECNILNSFTGKIDIVSNVINKIIEYISNGINALSFDNLQLSTIDFDNKNLSAYDYDFNGVTN